MRTVSITPSDMKYVPVEAVMRYKARIKAKFADAAASLRAADDKLGQVLDEFDDAHSDRTSLSAWEVKEMRITIRFVADMIDEGNAPSLKPRVFHGIASHPNEWSGNTPHIEGAILALCLAQDSLESGLELAGQFDGDDIDSIYETPCAAWSIVKNHCATLGCQSILFDCDRALETILAGKRTLALAA